VATTSVSQLLDYCKHTPEDGLRSAMTVQTINSLIDRNKPYIG
jgi:4-O-beta-D-mannosyl-D-glucose phosphorylase